MPVSKRSSRWLALVSVLLLLVASPANAVYNAVNTDWDDRSEVVSIEYNGGHYCGGTLLNDSWVLTAAHCVVDVDLFGCTGGWDLLLRDLDQCYIYANDGGVYLQDWTARSADPYSVRTASGSTVDVAELLIYPGFQWAVNVDDPGWRPLPCLWTCAKVRGLDYVAGDLALMRLSRRAPSARSRLASDADLLTAGRQVTLYEWGDQDPGAGDTSGAPARDNGEIPTSRPNSLRLDPPHDECVADTQRLVLRSILCAISPNSDSGSGGADSGGPLFATDVDGQLIQIGVTSFGPSEGFPTSLSQASAFSSIPRFVNWARSKVGGSTDNAGVGEDNVATALVIDNSGSMSSNDPNRRRLDASVSYISTALGGDLIGAVGFESSAYDISPMTKMPDGRRALTDALTAQIRDGGGTTIGAGLTRACSMLDNTGLPGKRAAILLTDGQGGYTDEASCFARRGWRVFTIGLGSGVNGDLLRQIADQTGGTYQPVPDAADLQCRFQAVRSRIAGASPVPCVSDLIRLGQTITKVVPVAARLAQVVFSITWPGSDVEMTLRSPSGRVISRGTTSWDVRHENGPTFETYTIQVPEPGNWTVELLGKDIAPAGEFVNFGVSPLPLGNKLPTLAPTSSPQQGGAPLTVSFTAGASDPDGSVASVLWDFGDGERAIGATVTHTYRNRGEYVPSVTAVDDQAETATAVLAPVRVSGAPPVAAFTANVSGRSVTFDASGSTDPDGRITRYGWDFDSDGTIDAQGTSATATWTYTAAGEYTATLGVESDDGQTAFAEKAITVKGVVPSAVFSVAAVAGQSRLFAIGAANRPGAVTGILDGRLLPQCASYRGRAGDDRGPRGLRRPFTSQGQQWEIRFTPLFGPIGTVAVCGPVDCASGSGVAFVT